MKLEAYPKVNYNIKIGLPEVIDFGNVAIGTLSAYKIELPNNFIHDLKFHLEFDEKDKGIFDAEFLNGVLFANQTRKLAIQFTPHKIKEFQSSFKFKIDYQGFKSETVIVKGKGVPHETTKKITYVNKTKDIDLLLKQNENI